jgi:hypothetical protein
MTVTAGNCGAKDTGAHIRRRQQLTQSLRRNKQEKEKKVKEKEGERKSNHNNVKK